MHVCVECFGRRVIDGVILVAVEERQRENDFDGKGDKYEFNIVC